MPPDAHGPLARLKRPLLYLMGPLYVFAGVMHFVVPEVYAQVVPPSLPRPLDLVYVSGVAEIVLGVGVLIPRTRRVSAWGLVALLAAVFPSNVYMATHDLEVMGAPDALNEVPDTALWARLPLQAVLALWAWWYTKPMPGEAN